LIFIVFIKILFSVHLKHSSVWLSADVNPMSNDLVHAMPLQSMYVHSMCMPQYLWVTQKDLTVILCQHYVSVVFNNSAEWHWHMENVTSCQAFT
jgi:hypothetical protein